MECPDPENLAQLLNITIVVGYLDFVDLCFFCVGEARHGFTCENRFAVGICSTNESPAKGFEHVVLKALHLETDAGPWQTAEVIFPA